MSRTGYKFILILFLLILPSVCFAMNSNISHILPLVQNEEYSLSVGVQTAMMNGETRELVFEVDYFVDTKISELVWKMDDTVLLGGIISGQVWNRLFLNLGYWQEVASSTARMQDSDWLYSLYGFPWKSDYSASEIEIDEGKLFDFNAAWKLWDYKGDAVSSMFPCFSPDAYLYFTGIWGYKKDKWGWADTNGYYVYNLRTAYGRFDDEPGISYNYELTAPYVGMGVNLNDRNLAFSAFVVTSAWVEADAKDIHYLRDLEFKDSFGDGDYLSYGLNLSWEFLAGWVLTGSFLYEKVEQTRGDEVVVDMLTGESVEFPDSAGISHNSNTYSVAVSYKFP